MRFKKNVKREIFTLIEVVVVIVILMMLVSIATPIYSRHVRNAKISTAKTQLKLIEQSLLDFKLDVGNYPESLEALTENVDQAEKWDGPYIKPNVPRDPWGNEYIYVLPGEHGEFDLSSYGRDGQPGGEGEDADINNWE